MVDDNDNETNLLAESNTDWAATAAIYGEASTQVNPLVVKKGFCGCLRIPISVSKVAFVRKVTPDEGDLYRYFSVKKTPVLRIEFEYIYETGQAEEEEEEQETAPHALRLKWDHYPEEWPVEEKSLILAWLSEKSNQLLKEEKISFCVCEFCEHEALSYWDTFHQGDEYRMLFLPPKMDLLYHSNIGCLIHPKEAARREPPQNNIKPAPPSSVEEFARRTLIERWRSLYSTTCPICFDTLRYDKGTILPCGDFFCEDCFPTYLRVKVTELQNYRTNPFLCPMEKCRQDLPIVGFVKKFLSEQDMERVRKWNKDLKFPPCFSLDRCLSPSCAALESMRRRPNVKSNVYCDICDKTWCEFCLKRIRDDDTTLATRSSSHLEICDGATALTFCQRYLAASDHQKQKCREKYPWIVSYAHSRAHDGEAMVWILKNGQCCPTCQTGVERTEGCFHMQCPTCATHFCYECGESLVPPYYGTHHCWERNNMEFL